MKCGIVINLFILVFCLSILTLISYIFLTPASPVGYSIIGFIDSMSVSLKPEDSLGYILCVEGYKSNDTEIIDLNYDKDVSRISATEYGSVVYRYGIDPGDYRTSIVAYRKILGITLKSNPTKTKDIHVRAR
ncbi:MAG: hypothetical protein PHF63_11960 [Herbinix sp.]|nr:hypothetical protein [Herbinix sp.]